MNDAEFQAQQERIVRLFMKWRDRMWLTQWTLHFSFFREGIPCEPRDDSDKGEPRFVTDSKWEYLRAHIKADVGDIVGITDVELEASAVHELGHCVVAEMRHTSDDYWKHEERVVCTITDMLLTCVQEAADGGLDVEGTPREEAPTSDQPVGDYRTVVAGYREPEPRGSVAISGRSDGRPETRPIPAYTGGVNGASDASRSD